MSKQKHTELPERLSALLAHLVEETITPSELSELEQLLDNDPEAQRQYLYYLETHVGLKESDCEECRPTQSTDATTEFRRRSLVGWIAAAAAIIALITIVSWPDKQERVATVVELNGAVRWTGDGGQVVHDLAIGDSLSGGTLESLAADSWIQIAFEDDSSVTISGSSSLTISKRDGRKLLHLRRGHISANVEPQPENKPLKIITPSAEAVVLGTQFNIIADELITSLTVNKGLVRVTRLADGSVQEVPADHQVVASLEQDTEFKAQPRRQHANTWKGVFPQDVRHGSWVAPEGSGEGYVKAQPLLWKENPDKPVMLHVTLLSVSAYKAPVVLEKGTKFHVRGQINKTKHVVFGITTNHAKGGFAGKYVAAQEIKVEEGESEAKGQFEVSLPLESFNRQKKCFPSSPVGHEIFDVWVLTIEEDVGLEIFEIELLKE